MSIKKFAGIETLQAFLDGCKTIFANITHKHTMSDITDIGMDWNQNDELAPDYIKNRTHYKTQTFETIFPKQTVELTLKERDDADSVMTGYIIEEEGASLDLWNEEDFIVTINGVEYQCTSRVQGDGIVVGNSTLNPYFYEEGFPEDYPFYIQYVNEYTDVGDGLFGITYPAEWYFSFADTTLTNVEIEIKKSAGSTIKTLDEEYIPNTIARKEDIPAQYTPIYYGVCSDEAGTASSYTVDTTDDFKLIKGTILAVKFINQHNVYGAFNMNVNNTGDKTVNVNNSGGSLAASSIRIFIYDGAAWIESYWKNTQYDLPKLGIIYCDCDTAAGTTEKICDTNSAYDTVASNTYAYIRFKYAVISNSTLKIGSTQTCPIYYKDAPISNGIIQAGDIALFVRRHSSKVGGHVYTLISIDRWGEDIDNLKTYVDTKFEGVTDSLELITVDDIDTICGGAIQYAEDVMF
jgi:hypothetical protein